MRYILIMLLMVVVNSGCGALKAFKQHVSGVDDISVTKPVKESAQPVKKTQAVKATPVVPPSVRPQRSPYDSIADDSLGSIWTEKGQENFYFSRNTRRRAGDIIILKVGSDIDDLVAEKFRSYFSRLESQKAVQSTTKKSTSTIATTSSAVSDEKVEVGDVTMRLVKALDRGSFEVSGQKPMYYKGRKFDVSISGIVKLEDINADDTVTSSRLLESNVLLSGGSGI